MAVNNVGTVNMVYGMYAFKKANQLHKDAAKKLLESVPKPRPLPKKNKVDTLA